MSILKNAVDSIAIGLEDFESSDPRRVISSTRNIFAGILLLFKHKLVSLSSPESDEALIKQRVLPVFDQSGQVRWTGKGKNTVDVPNIKERFESLAIDVDWDRIEKLRRFRNDIEHYYKDLRRDAIRSLISDSFIVINEFVRKHLGQDPKTLLGDHAWSVLIEVNEVYEREKAECTAALQSLEFFNDEIGNAFEHYSCEGCGSGLIVPSICDGEALEAEYVCKSCGHALPYEDIVKFAVADYYSADVYLSYTDGGDSPIADCPECDGIYLYNEGVCSFCGHVAEHECQRCGSTIMPEELSSEPFCGYCAHVMAKDD